MFQTRPNVKVNIISSDLDHVRELSDALSLLEADIRYFEEHRQYLTSPVQDQPGCVLLDTTMPGGTGIDALQELNDRSGLPVIVLSRIAEPRTIVKVIKAGARDFIPKPVDRDVLLEAIQEAVSAHIQEMPLRKRLAEFETRLESLTRRERQIMAMLLDGANGKEIAHRLRISPRTVEHHRSHILGKMGGETMTRLVYLFGRFNLQIRSELKGLQ